MRLGILHTIFFHRFFPSIRPRYWDLLDLTLPLVPDVELESLIDQRTTALIRQIDHSDHDATTTPISTHNPSVRGQIAVQFFEKRRRKAWFSTKAEEEVCWEQWTLNVTLATPRTESGRSSRPSRRTYMSGLANEGHRESKGPKGDGDDASEDCDENRHHGELQNGSYPANHNERG